MESLVTWITTHALGLVVGIVLLILVYRYAKPFTHRIVLTVLRAQQATLEGGGAPADELRKRADTLEDLFNRIIRVTAIILVLALLLSVFDLWPMVAGLSLVIAALTIAGQQIILDYLMGILILIEGQFYKGDWISIHDPGSGVMLEGEVEEVGLRRTTLRDMAGVQHSISNGQIRIASNWTRVYEVSSIQVRILRGHDLARALEVVEKVSHELMQDPEWKERILEAPHMTTISDMTIDGAVFWVRARTQPADRWNLSTEMIRRLAAAMAAEGISTARWDPSAVTALSPTQIGLSSEGSA
jgi:moderate conductance mechanosensitive channel